MFCKCIQFCIAKSMVSSVMSIVLKSMHKEHESVLRERLGFGSIDEYMRATPEEIKQRQKGF